MNTSTKIVILSFLLVFAYTVTSIVLAIHGVVLPDILTESVVKFFGYEMIALSGIKITKHICGGRALQEALDEDLAELDGEVSNVNEN